MIKAGKAYSKQALTDTFGVNHNTTQSWKKAYEQWVIELLLTDKRGGNKQSPITPKAHRQLKERLSNPKTGFRSFIEIQQWLEACTPFSAPV